MDEKKPQQEEKKESESSNVSFDAQIFSMPERYQHGAEAKLVEPKKPEAKPKHVVAPPPPPKPLPPKPKPVVRKKGMSTTTKVIMISGGVVIVLLIAFAGYVYFSASTDDVAVDDTTDEPISRPAPDPEPEPEPEPEPDPEPDPEPADPFEIEVTPGTDSDSDGLSDVEENLVYDTNPRLPDTDSDGFLDGNEVFHSYNPGGTAPGTLLGSGLVTAHEGQALTVLYEIYYPSVWDIEEVDNEMVIDADTGEGFRITYETLDADISIGDWVEENTALENVLEAETKLGLEMVQSENGLFVFLDLSSAVLILEYDTGTKTRVDYLQTFQMMLNSIQVTGEVEVEIEPESDESVEAKSEEEAPEDTEEEL